MRRVFRFMGHCQPQPYTNSALDFQGLTRCRLLTLVVPHFVFSTGMVCFVSTVLCGFMRSVSEGFLQLQVHFKKSLWSADYAARGCKSLESMQQKVGSQVEYAQRSFQTSTSIPQTSLLGSCATARFSKRDKRSGWSISGWRRPPQGKTSIEAHDSLMAATLYACYSVTYPRPGGKSYKTFAYVLTDRKFLLTATPRIILSSLDPPPTCLIPNCEL